MIRDGVRQGKAAAGQMGTPSRSAEKRQNLRHRIWGKGYQRLSSKRGASLAVALLGFLLCATVGSVVLAAASASMGRTEKPDSDADRQRYSLESAAAYIRQDIEKSTEPAESDGSTGDIVSTGASGLAFSDQQSWNVAIAQADYISLNGNGAGDNLTVEADSQEYGAGPKTKIGGDYILPLDQNEEDSKKSIDAMDSDVASKNQDYLDAQKKIWKTQGSTDSVLNTFSYETDFFKTAKQRMGLSATTHTVSLNESSNVKLHSLQELRNVCAEQIFRHYWANAACEDEVGNSDTSTRNDSSWGDTGKPSDRSWEQITAGDSYEMRMKHLKIDVSGNGEGSSSTGSNTESRTIYPVYADVTMDQNFNLMFHLYCGSADSSNGTNTIDSIKKADDSMLSLWVYWPCDTQNTTVTYKNENALPNTISDVYELSPLILHSQEMLSLTGQYTSSDMPKDEGSDTDENWSKVQLLNVAYYDADGTSLGTKSADENAPEGADPARTVTTFQIDHYEKLHRMMHVWKRKRTVSLKLQWNAGIVSTKQPTF